MTTFLVQKRDLSEKFIILNNQRYQLMTIFNDDFRAREREREEKGTTNFHPVKAHLCTVIKGHST